MPKLMPRGVKFSGACIWTDNVYIVDCASCHWRLKWKQVTLLTIFCGVPGHAHESFVMI